MSVRITVNQASGSEINKAALEYFENTLGPRVVSNAKRIVPVDTYNLQDHIEYNAGIDGNVARLIVGTDVDYGLYVEEGTSRMAAQPWLKPAAQQAGASS